MDRPTGTLTLLLLLLCGAAVPRLSAGQAVAGQDAAPQPSASGACIAIVLPRLEGVEGDATAIAGSVRDLFASFLRGPSMQIVPLEARLASLAVDEAREKQCPWVLMATITQKRGGNGNGGGLLGSVIGQAAWGMPMGGVGAAVTHGAVQAISEMASSTKARDEIKLDYKLASVDGKTSFGPKSEKAKAKADGEDLLTPMVERAAEAIVGVVKR